MKRIVFVATLLASLILLIAVPGQAIAAGGPSATPVTISINSPSVREGDAGTKTMTFKVTLSTRSSSTVTVAYQSYDGSAISVASLGNPADYVATSGTLVFAPGVKSQSIAVTIIGDTRMEPNENFVMLLSNPTGGATLLDPQGIGTIINDDR